LKKFKDVINQSADRDRQVLEYLNGTGKTLVFEGYFGGMLFHLSDEAYEQYVSYMKKHLTQSTRLSWVNVFARGSKVIKTVEDVLGDNDISHDEAFDNILNCSSKIQDEELDKIMTVGEAGNYPIAVLINSIRAKGAKRILKWY